MRRRRSRCAGVLGVFTGRDLVADGVGTIPTLIAERGGGIRSRDGSPFAEPPVVSPGDGPRASRRRARRHRRRDDTGGGPGRRRRGGGGLRGAAPRRRRGSPPLAEGAPDLHAGVTRNRCYDWECGDAAATARAIEAAAHVTRLTLARQPARHLLPGAARGPRRVGRRPPSATRCTPRCRASTPWPSTSPASSASRPRACAA